MRGIPRAPQISRRGHPPHVRPAIPARPMRTRNPLWDKGGALTPIRRTKAARPEFGAAVHKSSKWCELRGPTKARPRPA